MNNPIFDKFLSDTDSYHNFTCRNHSTKGISDMSSQDNYFATDISSIKLGYKKMDPFITLLPNSFFEKEEDLDDTQIENAIAYFQSK